MSEPETRAQRRWPLWVWALQLVPAGSLATLVAVLAASAGYGARSVLLLGAVALAWCTVAGGMLITRSGRRFIASRPGEWMLSWAAIAIALLVGDALLTLSGAVPTIQHQRDRSIEYTYYRYSGYRMVPKSVIVDGGEPILINARGFRGPDVERPRPAGRVTIAFLGGSQVFDYHGGDWPAMTGAILRDRRFDVEVINAGVPGHNSTDSLTKLLSDLWTLQPDVVVACHGWNDIKFFGRMSASQPYRGLPPPAPVTMHRDWRLHPQGLDRLLSRSAVYRHVRGGLIDLFVTAEGRDLWEFPRPAADATFDATGPRQFELNLRLLAALIREIGARAVFCQQAMLTRGTSASGIDAADYARHNLPLSQEERGRALAIVRGIVDAVVRDTNATLLDMRTALSDRPEYFHDAVHFSPAGSRAAARLAADTIERLLPAVAESARP